MPLKTTLFLVPFAIRLLKDVNVLKTVSYMVFVDTKMVNASFQLKDVPIPPFVLSTENADLMASLAYQPLKVVSNQQTVPQMVSVDTMVPFVSLHRIIAFNLKTAKILGFVPLMVTNALQMQNTAHKAKPVRKKVFVDMMEIPVL